MTVSQKAEYLINKMYYTQSSPTNWNKAKECALIAVDEMIDVLSKDINPLVNYWFEVKQEIEKL